MAIWRLAVMRANLAAIALILALILPCAYSASSPPDIFIKGALQVQAEKDVLNAGEALKLKITVSNLGDCPIADGAVVVEIVRGAGMPYPSQSSDAGTVFYEEVLGGITLAAGQKKEISFGYVLPSDISAGDYAAQLYFRTARAPIAGIAHLFASPLTVPFKVANQAASAEFPMLNIVRTKTEFNGYTGPVGAPAEAGSKIIGRVYVQNLSRIEVSGAEVFVALCEWDDTACDKYISESTQALQALKAGATASADAELSAPTQPSAYAIRIEVRDAQGRVLSLYRNRVIVQGGTAKIRKMLLNKAAFAQGDAIEVNFLLGPSPDHYANPVFENFSLDVELKGTGGGGVSLTGSENYAKISSETGYYEKRFTFTAPEALAQFTLCGKVVKEGKEYDRYCYEVNSAGFAVEKKIESKLSAEWKYEKTSGLLTLKLCRLSAGKEIDMNSHYFLQDSASGEIVKQRFFSSRGCYSDVLPVPQAKYLLVLDDYISKTQKSFAMDLFRAPEEKPVGAEKTCAQLGGSVCPQGEGCTATFARASDSARCCTAKCAPKGSVPPPQSGGDLFSFFLILIGVVLLAIAFLILRKGRKKETPFPADSRKRWEYAQPGGAELG
ncbi:MAG: LPXTG cell wall anchor domain-containing protein [Candidatus Diapherotrites archaeon]